MNEDLKKALNFPKEPVCNRCERQNTKLILTYDAPRNDFEWVCPGCVKRWMF